MPKKSEDPNRTNIQISPLHEVADMLAILKANIKDADNTDICEMAIRQMYKDFQIFLPVSKEEFITGRRKQIEDDAPTKKYRVR